MTTETPIRLNIGAGDTNIPGYTPIDRKYGMEAYPLQYPDESVADIYTSHVIEHFPAALKMKVLEEWYRVLKPGGRIRISTVDLRKWAQQLLDGEANYDSERVLYGGQVDENDFHQCGFDQAGLRLSLERVGFICVEPFTPTVEDTSRHPVSMNIQAMKPTESMTDTAKRLSLCMVMTSPRVGFVENFVSITKAAGEMGIPLYHRDGAYFDKGMEGMLRESARAGHDYAISVDYDTVFRPVDVLKLVAVAERNPHADAIASTQCRREADQLLVCAEGKYETAADLDHELIPAKSAHFGLTIFRCKAFENERLANPAMIHKPKRGEGYGPGCVDADVNFWRNWRKAGNTLFLAPRVTVGHLEMVVSWPTESMSVGFQRLSEYRTLGKPNWARQ